MDKELIKFIGECLHVWASQKNKQTTTTTKKNVPFRDHRLHWKISHSATSAGHFGNYFWSLCHQRLFTRNHLRQTTTALHFPIDDVGANLQNGAVWMNWLIVDPHSFSGSHKCSNCWTEELLFWRVQGKEAHVPIRGPAHQRKRNIEW